MKNIVCFDIGGTSVKYALANEDGLHDQGSFATDRANGQNVLDSMSRVIRACMNKYDAAGISISSPGFVDNKTGLIKGGNIIQGFNGLNIRDYFKNEFGLPTAIENDANSATIAEHYMGNAKGCENAAVVTLGTGVGGGLVINNKLYTGSAHMAGEFGFMFINGIHTDKPEDEILSGYASTAALARNASKDANEELSGLQVFERADAGDLQMQKRVSDFYDAIAMGIYNIAYTMNPDAVLIGGGVSAREDIIDEIKKRIDNLNPSFSVRLLDIMKIDRCRFLNDAGLFGAYSNFMNTFA